MLRLGLYTLAKRENSFDSPLTAASAFLYELPLTISRSIGSLRSLLMRLKQRLADSPCINDERSVKGLSLIAGVARTHQHITHLHGLLLSKDQRSLAPLGLRDALQWDLLFRYSSLNNHQVFACVIHCNGDKVGIYQGMQSTLDPLYGTCGHVAGETEADDEGQDAFLMAKLTYSRSFLNCL